MKKVNLENCLVNVEESTEALKNVNGGCTVQVGRCSRDGKYYIGYIYKYCSKNTTVRNNHIKKALDWGKKIGLSRGQTIKITIE